MSKKKYRVVQVEESKWIIEEWLNVDYDPRDRETIYNWVKIDEVVGMDGENIAKRKVDELVEKSAYPKVVYEKEA